MTPGDYVPERGDVVWVDLNPVVGHEQAGRRPALVLSPSLYNNLSGLILVCPITRSVKRYVFEVPIPSGAPIAGVVLADHARSLDWRRRGAVFAGRLSVETLTNVQENLTKLIGAEVV